MRTLLFVALSITTASLSKPADACGSYEPSMFRLTSHHIFDGLETRVHTRSFVLLPWDTAPRDGLAWRLISPRSFDATEIADAPALDAPMTLTLLGPGGSRVVTLAKRVFLARSWEFDHPIGALELPTDDKRFVVAIEGKHDRAKWITLDRVVDKDPNRDVSRIRGTRFVTETGYEDGKTITRVKQGSKTIATTAGWPLGAFVEHGVLKLVAGDKQHVSQVSLGRV